MSGLDAGGLEQLPNKFAPLGPVIGEALVGPFAGDQDSASGDAEVFGAMCFALAASRCLPPTTQMGSQGLVQPR